MKSRSAVLLSALWCSSLICTAQVQRGSISGTVFDSQGAVVPSAQVTATDGSTGAAFTVKTSNEGTFTIPGLAFGNYSVRVAASGFRQWEATSVQVVTAQASSLMARLAVVGSGELVTSE